MSAVFEVHVEGPPDAIREVTIYSVGEHGQLGLVAAEQFGPFDTSLEVSQWVWRVATRHLVARPARV